MHAIRCDHDGLKMAEVQNGHLILRAKHHGETHVKIVPLAELMAEGEVADAGIGCDQVMPTRCARQCSTC